MEGKIKALSDFVLSIGSDQAMLVITLAALGLVGFALYVILVVISNERKR